MTPSLSFVLLPLLAVPALAQGGRTAPQGPAQGVVFYDYLEGGHLAGGVLPVDPHDPLLANTGEAPARSRSAWTTLISNGPSSNRVDLVFVGDGYLASQLSTYANEVDNVTAAFFNLLPLDRYESFFNVHRVDVVSAESGVDNDPSLGVMKNTALDMGYYCGGVQRAICVNISKALNQARNAPDVDQILALANSSTYGGSGYPTNDIGAIAGGNSAAIQIALHEFGHAFADLADEYDYGGPTTWTGGEPSTADVSIYDAVSMGAQQRKWYRWLTDPNVGTFEGANYSVFGIYRPTNDSLMRDLYRPLEQVNVEQFVFSLYHSVRPIDDATPAGVYGSNQVFFVDPVVPIGYPLDVQWSVDGTPLPGATGTTFDVGPLGLGAGAHTVSVAVVDDTTLVRDETKRMQLMRQVKSWTVDDSPQVLPYGCGANPAGSLVLKSGLPRPGETLVFDVANPIGTNAPGSLPILLISTEPDPSYPCGTPLPAPRFSMDPTKPSELLIRIEPGYLAQPFVLGPVYGGYLTPPVQVPLTIPSSSSLLGTSLWLQGVLYDPTGSFGVRYPLTSAYQLRIGQ